MQEGSLFTPSPAFIACRLLDHSHSDWPEMVPHSGFDLHRCPSVDEWIRKLWYIYTMEYYSAIKKNTFESVLMGG